MREYRRLSVGVQGGSGAKIELRLPGQLPAGKNKAGVIPLSRGCDYVLLSILQVIPVYACYGGPMAYSFLFNCGFDRACRQALEGPALQT